MEASEKPMEGRVSEGHPSWYQEAPMIESRPSAVLAFRKHISGGAVVAGTLVALAIQVLFIAFGGFLGVGAATVATLGDLNGIVTSVGIWVAVSAVIATFIGAYVAARLAGTTLARNGMWHGLTTWALVIMVGVVLAMFGFGGILGFGVSTSTLVNAYLPNASAITAGDLTTAASIAGTMSGWFLVGVLGSLLAAVFGGWAGGLAISRRAEAAPREEEEERVYRRAA